MPWYLETEELIRRVTWAEAVYVKGEERRSVAYLEDIASYLKFCLDVMQASRGGLRFTNFNELSNEVARWLASEIMEFYLKIKSVPSDSALSRRAECIAESLRAYLLGLCNKSEILG